MEQDKDKPKQDASFTAEEQAAEAQNARKKLKQAEKAKLKKEKPAKEKKHRAKKFAKWWKDFRGELKKIQWPSFGTVIKNTGIVLVTVAIIGALVWVVDIGLSNGIKGLKSVAKNIPTRVTTTVPAGASDSSVGTEAATTVPTAEATTAPQQ